MSRHDPSAARGQIPYEPGPACRCTHPETVHAIGTRGRTACSASSCGCRRYTPEETR